MNPIIQQQNMWSFITDLLHMQSILKIVFCSLNWDVNSTIRIKTDEHFLSHLWVMQVKSLFHRNLNIYEYRGIPCISKWDCFKSQPGSLSSMRHWVEGFLWKWQRFLFVSGIRNFHEHYWRYLYFPTYSPKNDGILGPFPLEKNKKAFSKIVPTKRDMILFKFLVFKQIIFLSIFFIRTAINF